MGFMVATKESNYKDAIAGLDVLSEKIPGKKWIPKSGILMSSEGDEFMVFP